MTDRPAATGRCACGSIRFSVAGRLREVINCHCHRCRRITGHHMAATSADLSDLDVDDGTDRLCWWEASPGVFYGFCRTCGSTLFWRNDDEPHRWSIAAGTLDPPTGLITTEAIWTSDASDYHDLGELPSRPFD